MALLYLILLIILMIIALIPLVLLRSRLSRHSELERYESLVDTGVARVARGQPPYPDMPSTRRRREEE